MVATYNGGLVFEASGALCLGEILLLSRVQHHAFGAFAQLARVPPEHLAVRAA